MKRILGLAVLTVFAVGCIPLLTPEEKVKADEIRAKYEAAIQAGKEAKVAAEEAKAKVEEGVAAAKEIGDRLTALYASIKEDGINLTAVLAKIKELVPIKEQIEGLVEDAKAEVLKMQAKGEEAAGEAVGATRDMKALEKRVVERIQADGEKANRFWTWVGVVLAVVGGGAGALGGTKVAAVVAAARKLKTAFGVVTHAIGADAEGRADAKTCEAIKGELAGVNLSEDELEKLWKENR